MALREDDHREVPKILLCVTGCVQAEVTPRLAKVLMQHSEMGAHEVIVVATRPSLQFFDRTDVENITKRKVFVDHTESTPEFEVPHIGLAEWAELVMVYPASANTIAKCAYGFSDSLVANIVMAARCPVFFGPTMNERMYESSAVRRNIKLLKSNGYYLVPKERTQVKIRASGKFVEKDYCSEAMVLAVVNHLFHRKIKGKRRKK